jgi:hypothetical protein
VTRDLINIAQTQLNIFSGILILMARNTPLYIVAPYVAIVRNITPPLSENLLQ